MPTKRSVLLQRLAQAREAKAAKNAPQAPQKPPKPLVEKVEAKSSTEQKTLADSQRDLAKKTAEQAMISGWPKAIQMNAYENQISEFELVKILDAALDYNDKADPSGRISELDDWKHERRGTERSASSLRPS